MKNYADYMDNISVDAQLHEKIIRHAAHDRIPAKRAVAAYRFAGVAAAAAVIVFCVWLIPGLFNNPADPGPIVPPGGNYPLVHNGDPINAAVPTLTFNRINSQISVSRIFADGHFWHDLTAEQLSAIFPDLGFPIFATADYSGDGSLFGVTAYEISNSGDIVMQNEFFIRTTIQLAPGAVVSGVIFDYEPIESYILGVPVVAGVLDLGFNDNPRLYTASFEIDGIAYRVKLHDDSEGDEGQNRLSAIVGEIIRNGAADLIVLADPVIPELRNDRLTLTEARMDPDFGAFIPGNIPPQFGFESAYRFINQDTNALFVLWGTGRMDTLHWQISRPTEHDLRRIVSADQRERFDMSLYSIPFFDSIPEELWQYVHNPVFLAEEMTLDIVRARAYNTGRGGSASDLRIMNFGVLYGDVVISVSAGGVSPEEVWMMLSGVMESI